MINLNHSRNLAVRRRAGRFHVLFLLSVLIAALAVMLAGQVTAQNFTTLHSFAGSDGVGPRAGLLLSGNTLYGTTAFGFDGFGVDTDGTVFAVNTDATGFTNLHGLFFPQAGLISSGNTLYGTTTYDGSSGSGTVFAVKTDGTGFTNLHSFTAGSTNFSGVYTNSDGASPFAGLILSSNTLFGTTLVEGKSGYGTVFKLNTDGTAFTNLHSFTLGTDGGNPRAGLTVSGQHFIWDDGGFQQQWHGVQGQHRWHGVRNLA